MAFSSGKYYPEVRQGNVFIGSTAAAGVALPAAGGTAMTFGLWNTSSGKNAVLMNFAASYVSGTITVAGFGLTLIPNAGLAIATGGPISAFTSGAATNALLNGGGNSSMLFTPSAATIVAGTRFAFLGSGHEIATAGPGISNTMVDLNGSLVLTPGTAAFVTTTIAQTGLFAMSLTWAEVPAN
jgi:hypothetical protein